MSSTTPPPPDHPGEPGPDVRTDVRREGERSDLPATMVEARGLTKRFGSFEAVKCIDVTVHRGEAYGFLGPNGAGKSSTMRMIAAVSPPTSAQPASAQPSAMPLTMAATRSGSTLPTQT